MSIHRIKLLVAILSAFVILITATASYAQDNTDQLSGWEQDAADGNAEAAINLGDTYREGWGVEKNELTAFRWYLRAAQLGAPIAQYMLGIFYSIGYGVEQNYQEAVRWLTLAANQGYAAAQYSLANIYFEGKSEPQKKSSVNGSVQVSSVTQKNIGLPVYSNIQIYMGTQRDSRVQKTCDAQGKCCDALKNCCDARGKCCDAFGNCCDAQRTCCDAQGKCDVPGSNSGNNSENNGAQTKTGVLQDKKAAIYWYKKAAAQGYADAEYSLGMAYHTGNGVAQDDDEAFRLLQSAQSHGNTQASAKLPEVEQTQSIYSRVVSNLGSARNSISKAVSHTQLVVGVVTLGCGIVFFVLPFFL